MIHPIDQLVLVITPLAGEMEPIRRSIPRPLAKSTITAVAGIGSDRMERALRSLLEARCFSAVVLTGTAGSLHEGCKPGDVIVATGICGATRTNSQWIDRCWSPADKDLMADALTVNSSAVRAGAIVCVDRYIDSAGMRDGLFSLCGAECAEMEGAAVADLCTSRGVPWTAIRGISDRACTRVEAVPAGEFEAAASAAAAVTIALLAARAKRMR